MGSAFLAQANQVATANGDCAVAINASGQAKVTVTNHCDAGTEKTVQRLLDKSRRHDQAINRNDVRIRDVEADNSRLKQQIEELTAAVATVLEQARASDATRPERLAAKLLMEGDESAAIALLGREADSAAAASRRSARDAVTLYVQQASLQRVRDPNEALRTIDRALALATEDPYLLEEAADLVLVTGDTAGAIARSQVWRQTAESVLSVSPEESRWLLSLAWSRQFLGSIRRDQGDIRAALVEYRHELLIRERIAALVPDEIESHHQIVLNQRKIARACEEIGDLDCALLSARKSLIHALIAAEMSTDTGEQPWYVSSIADSHKLVGDVLRKRKKYADALQAYRDGLAVISELVDASTGYNIWVEEQFEFHHLIGRFQLMQGQRAAATQTYRMGLVLLRTGAGSNPYFFDQWHDRIVGSLLRAGDAKKRSGEVSAARAEYTDAVMIAQSIFDADVENAESRRTLAESYARLGHLEENAGQYVQAVRHHQAARGHYKALIAKNPDDSERRYDYAMSCLDVTMLGDVAGTPDQRRGMLVEGANIVIDMNSRGDFPALVDGKKTLELFKSAIEELLSLP